MIKKIFIACPISKYLDGNEFTNKEVETFIKSLHGLAKKYSENVFLALEREKFGKKRMEDHVCTPLDFKEMTDTDLAIIIPEDSMGVAVEIGWASALNKKILLILDEKYKQSPLVCAIDTVTDCIKLNINSKDENKGYCESLLRKIEDILISISNKEILNDQKDITLEAPSNDCQNIA